MDLQSKVKLALLHAKILNLYLIIKFISRSANMSETHMLSLKQRIEKAVTFLPAIHRLPPEVYKDTFAHQEEAKLRYQNWAFTQGIAIVVEKNDVKHGMYVLECSRHKKETKNRRKKEQDDLVRPGTKTSAMNCQFLLRFTWDEEGKVWRLTKTNLEHTHVMSPDPFVFIQHRDRDPDRAAAESLAMGMRTFHTKCGQAKRTLRPVIESERLLQLTT